MTLRSWKTLAIALGLTCFSTFFMAKIIARFPFHEDEAAYTSFSKDIVNGDLFLTTKGLDKPPVFFYVQAVAIRLLGENPITDRLPNCLALLLTNLILFLMIRRIFGLGTASFVLLFLATSPFLLLFGPTAFVDGVASLCGIWSLERLSQKKWGAAGSLATLAMFTKQYFGLFLFYDLIAMAMIPSLKQTPQTFKKWARGIVYTAIPLVTWETFCNRPPWYMLFNAKVAYGKWMQSITFHDSFLAWGTLYRLVLGSRILNGGLIAALTLLPFTAFFDVSQKNSPQEREKKRWELFFLFWFLSYFLLIAWQTRIPHWDRYLIPGAYPLCIIAGCGLSRFSKCLRFLQPFLFLSVLVTAFAFDVSHIIRLSSDYEFGANNDAYVGFPAMFQTLGSLMKDPRSAVLYDESIFFSRYYAYRWTYPVRETSANTLREELGRYMFCPIFFISKSGPLGIETLPHVLGPLWTGHSIASEGKYHLWILRPNETYRIPSTPKNIAAALAELTGHPATAAQEPSCTKLTMAGEIRDEIPAHITSCWTSVSVFKESGHYAIEGIPERTELRISAEEATRDLQQKNPTIRQLKIEISQPDQVTVTGAAYVGKYLIPFTLKSSPVLKENSEIALSNIQIALGDYMLPDPIFEKIQNYAPSQNLRIPHWIGAVHTMSLDPASNTFTLKT